MTTLYDFPDNYTGRKTFVAAVGHDAWVPKYKTYAGTDGKRHVLPEYGGNADAMGSGSVYILPDKLEYHSPLDGSIVSSRSTHREHMKRHDVVEAGDMKIGTGRAYEASAMPRAGSDIVRAMQQLRSR